MLCCNCYFEKLDSEVYPCSKCEGHDMFREKGENVTPEDIMVLINELHQLKEIVLELKEEIEKND